MYDEKVILGQATEKWSNMFKNSCTDVTDDYRVGRLSTSTTENIARVNEIIRTNRRITVDEIADTGHFFWQYSTNHHRTPRVIRKFTPGE